MIAGGAPVVAFQGELGAFSEEGIRQLWPGEVELRPCREFGDVAHAVAGGAADYGLLPIENTLAGSVVGSYDALAAYETLHIVGETVVAIHHCLLAIPGAELSSLRRVTSHPVALAQCVRFLRERPHLEVRASYDTAGAAREVVLAGDPHVGAIAGRIAAMRYGLAVLAENIEDRPDNQTRFVAISLRPAALAPDTPARTALQVTTANRPGALLRVLEPLAAQGLNMCKLESRPTGEPWTYRFFVEVEHAAGAPAVGQALARMGEVATALRVLGTYPAWSAGAVPAAALDAVRRPS